MQPTALVAYDKLSGRIILVHHCTYPIGRDLETRRAAIAQGSVPEAHIDIISVASGDFLRGKLYSVNPTTRQLTVVEPGGRGHCSSFGVTFHSRSGASKAP
jgi:hypothetical protein